MSLTGSCYELNNTVVVRLTGNSNIVAILAICKKYCRFNFQ